ncbi:hypothetical protein [common midwife toad virus -E]|uniref:Collagen-like protein n=1 Tax=Common midwife toad virus TaxID=540070 RepID=H6WEJ4_9VIRU|nr:hypothetical protein [common midwife toad virus -E]
MVNFLRDNILRYIKMLFHIFTLLNHYREILGQVGPTGRSGPVRPAGQVGLTGPRGENGDTGHDGRTGSAGPVRRVGPRGDK